MKIKKRLFDSIFIIVAGALLILFRSYGLIEDFIGYALIPLLIAYFLGQYSERKFK